MASVAVATPVDETALVEQMARNIRSLGRQRGLFDQDIAKLIGMAPPKFSTRMSGGSRWLATEIRLIASALNVSADAIYAESESAFRAALATDRRATRSEKYERGRDLRGLPRNTHPKPGKSLGSPIVRVAEALA